MPDETTVSTTAEETSTSTVDAGTSTADTDVTTADVSAAAADGGTTASDASATSTDGSQSKDSTTGRRRGARGSGVGGPSRTHATSKGSAARLSGGPEKTEVDTDKLRATADKGRQTIKTLNEKLANVIESVRATEDNSIWIGIAADDYREIFLHVLETFNKQLDLYVAYTRDLIAYADEQDQVITETNRLAQSVLEEIEAANWPEDL